MEESNDTGGMETVNLIILTLCEFEKLLLFLVTKYVHDNLLTQVKLFQEVRFRISLLII